MRLFEGLKRGVQNGHYRCRALRHSHLDMKGAQIGSEDIVACDVRG